MCHLNELESASIYMLREAYHCFKRPAILWSMGKDSNVLLWLAKKAFLGHIPMPVVHIDTTYEFAEMIEFRRWASEYFGLNLTVFTNQAALDRGVRYENHDPLTVTHELKTIALQQVVKARDFDAVVTGIRRDEDPVRAKERYFSPRGRDSGWYYEEQPPEFWDYFTTTVADGEHVRVQLLLDWTELDVWRYIAREGIPVPRMYFSQGGRRYRSIGCHPTTAAVESSAATVADIIAELEATRTSERSGRRAQDHHESHAMQKLRARGFM